MFLIKRGYYIVPSPSTALWPLLLGIYQSIAVMEIADSQKLELSKKPQKLSCTHAIHHGFYFHLTEMQNCQNTVKFVIHCAAHETKSLSSFVFQITSVS